MCIYVLIYMKVKFQPTLGIIHKCHSSCFFVLFKDRSLTSLEFSKLARLLTRETPELVLQGHVNTPIYFNVGAGDQTQVSMLIQETCYLLGYLLKLSSSFK